MKNNDININHSEIKEVVVAATTIVKALGATISDYMSCERLNQNGFDDSLESLLYSLDKAIIVSCTKVRQEQNEDQCEDTAPENNETHEETLSEEAEKCSEEPKMEQDQAKCNDNSWQIVLCGNSQYYLDDPEDSIFPYNKKMYFVADSIAEAFEEFYKQVTTGDFKLKNGKYGYKFKVDESEKYSYADAFLLKGAPKDETYPDLICSESYNSEDSDDVDSSYVVATNPDIMNNIRAIDYSYRLSIKKDNCCIYRNLKAITEDEAKKESRELVESIIASSNSYNIPGVIELERINNHDIKNIITIQSFTIAPYPDGSGFGLIVH